MGAEAAEERVDRGPVRRPDLPPRPPAVPTADEGRQPLGLVQGLKATADIWWGSRVAVIVLSLAAARTVTSRRVDQIPGFLQMWDRWDVGLFVKVARFGYFSSAYTDRTEVNYPGLPLAMRLVHPLVRNWVAAGLVVSALSGAVACAAIWALTSDESGPRAGRRAVLLLVAFPYSVFLFAGYSEGLFLAFASTSWLAARRERWVLAAVLACGATGTRVLGVAFLAALWVEYLTTRRWRRRTAERIALRTAVAGRRARPARVLEILALVLPVVPPLAYLGYLRVHTGHWNAYVRAEEAGWSRSFAMPWQGLATTWRQIFVAHQEATYQFFWAAEIVAVLIGIGLLIWLLRLRRWGEAVWTLGSLAIVTSSSWWDSGVRTALLWFPLFVLVARYRRALAPYLWVSAPLAAVFVVAFTSGAWVD